MEIGGFHGYRNINHPPANSTNNDQCMVREQDRFMPIANVIRIMRKILPPHAKISDDAKETIQECVSEYISFITGEANERCQREQRKTITAEDVLWAMSKLGFDDYVEPLTFYLHRYRELEGDRGAIRADPVVRRSPMEFGPPMGIPATFDPMFHMGRAPHHPAATAGCFGHPTATTINRFMKEGSSEAGSSSRHG
ncbi:Nuclear transcription factor Y subunit B-6 [Dionaea muscipula]